MLSSILVKDHTSVVSRSNMKVNTSTERFFKVKLSKVSLSKRHMRHSKSPIYSYKARQSYLAQRKCTEGVKPWMWRWYIYCKYILRFSGYNKVLVMSSAHHCCGEFMGSECCVLVYYIDHTSGLVWRCRSWELDGGTIFK